MRRPTATRVSPAQSLRSLMWKPSAVTGVENSIEKYDSPSSASDSMYDLPSAGSVPYTPLPEPVVSTV
jgi:hypothetical protein